MDCMKPTSSRRRAKSFKSCTCGSAKHCHDNAANIAHIKREMGILSWDLSFQSQAEFMFSCTGTGAYKYFGSFPLGPIAPGQPVSAPCSRPQPCLSPSPALYGFSQRYPGTQSSTNQCHSSLIWFIGLWVSLACCTVRQAPSLYH